MDFNGTCNREGFKGVFVFVLCRKPKTDSQSETPHNLRTITGRRQNPYVYGIVFQDATHGFFLPLFAAPVRQRVKKSEERDALLA